MKPFNEWFRKQCDGSGMMQKDIAKKLCVSQSSIAMWCEGTRQPSLKRLKDIARLYDVDVSELLRRL